MKKIVGILAATAVAASAFAVDFASTMRIDANLVDIPNGGDISILSTNSADVQDDDLFTFNVENDNAGVHFRFWANSADTAVDSYAVTADKPTDEDPDAKYVTVTDMDGSTEKYIAVDEDGNLVKATEYNGLKLRKSHIWWKPFDFMKVNVGYTWTATYTEEIHWWKDPTGAAINAWGESTEFDDAASCGGEGLEVVLTPIDGLTISGGVMPGFNNAFMAFDGNGGYAAYGAQAKYEGIYIGDFNLDFAGAWRDFGKDEAKIAAIGASLKNSDGFSGFVNGRFYLADTDGDGATGLEGIAIDNYFGIPVGPATIQIALPTVIRLVAGDVSFIRPDVKVSCEAILESNWTPYVEVECNEIAFADKGFNGMLIKAGADYANGAFTAKPSLNFNFDADFNLSFSVPVEFYFAL